MWVKSYLKKLSKILMAKLFTHFYTVPVIANSEGCVLIVIKIITMKIIIKGKHCVKF